MAEILAIANCRVSSDEQKSSGSLDRQGKSVQQAADELGVRLIQTWSGSVSSKKGLNVNRKDLEEMLELCKKNKNVKYVIIDELDRFMRSMLEIGYFLVLFNNLGVKVIFASQPDLKTETAIDTLVLMLEAYKAEGSNEERQRKSIRGQTAALQDGRYTFHPKPGYKKSTIAGVHEIHEIRGYELQKCLKRLAAGFVNPTNALIELNESKFMQDHAYYKMDKFRKIATDIYYAGIIEMNKQVKVSGIKGLHEPLITLDEHCRLIEIFDNKPKYQIGPKRNGNPKFPLNNLMEHVVCVDLKNKGRLVGFDHTNGKYKKIYQKYRCRSCNQYWHKENVDSEITDLFSKYEMPHDTQRKIINALQTVWLKDRENKIHEERSIRLAIINLEKSIEQKVESATDSANSAIKEDILKIIEKKKKELSNLELQLEKLSSGEDEDKKEFMEFAFSFIQDTGKHFLEPYITKEYRMACKQMLFPAGIYIDPDGKVYTPKVSTFFRGEAIEKSAEALDNSHLVRVRRL